MEVGSIIKVLLYMLQMFLTLDSVLHANQGTNIMIERSTLKSNSLILLQSTDHINKLTVLNLYLNPNYTMITLSILNANPIHLRFPNKDN